MTCDTEKVTPYLDNELSEKERIAFELHLANCTACQQELKELRSLFQVVEQAPLPAPSAHMELRFHGALHSFKQSLEQPPFWKEAWQNIKQLFVASPRWQTAYSILLVVAGMAAGYWLFYHPAKKESKDQLAVLSDKIEDMRQTMILSLLENPSPTERLKAVSYTEQAPSVDPQVINALFLTLNEDPNVNVRLVTLEALTKWGKTPEVRQGLVASIAKQTSPLVQIALADVMLRLQEKGSINHLKALLEKNDVSEPVKAKIERAIQKLIL